MINYDSNDLRPKTFYVQFERQRNGEFRVMRANVLEKTNQFNRNIKRVDARDFTRALRKNEITVA
jgi:hypothetical protein